MKLTKELFHKIQNFTKNPAVSDKSCSLFFLKTPAIRSNSGQQGNFDPGTGFKVDYSIAGFFFFVSLFADLSFGDFCFLEILIASRFIFARSK